ncbi:MULTISPECIES: CaiB/BaiF CoA transferase family protein [unclassified Halomonas]|uniref:CaiB/BaiF CoA transferase family protein n=1 Tax=Halomonas sp. N3-2A TaxID=2014541 RepID=UPI000B5B350D|nr:MULTISPECIES: CaiB/BaiF CoA-transferase family protein [unclassified Halomonas]ASK21648.1 carnitine dehydratase [Halomonas sp. N3-2A]UTD56365.1 CoA transferase [Halomonas sp. MS1]
MSGPLTGLTVVEFTGLGPAPLAGQLLADLGADVIAVDRKSGPVDKTDINRRGKRSIAVDLKSAKGRAAIRQVIDGADVLIEGFRPGVMEKLGLGPDDLHDRLIYARMTGWGQTGPLAQCAGHDINYLSLTGALQMIGAPDRPPLPPLNLVADFGGGSMFLVFGILAALFERQTSGLGQVIDAAMVDGVPAMMGLLHTMAARGQWHDTRGRNLLDGSAPFYRCYETADGKYMAAGPIEPQFFAEFLELADLPKMESAKQTDPEQWSEMHAHYEAIFKMRTQAEWTKRFEGTDACVSPVLNLAEVADHPHNTARGIFANHDGVLQAAPAPRFSRTQAQALRSPGAPGADTEAILREAGFNDYNIAALRNSDCLT